MLNNILKLSFFSFLFLSFTAPVHAQSDLSAADKMAVRIKKKTEARTIEGVQLGTLMCKNEKGQMVICSGSEFEQILGFATNIPYVTVNKPKKTTADSEVNFYEFSGFASLASGKISKGDYLTAGKNGTVIRCEKSDFPYAVALEDAYTEGQKISVKILGNRK